MRRTRAHTHTENNMTSLLQITHTSTTALCLYEGLNGAVLPLRARREQLQQRKHAASCVCVLEGWMEVCPSCCQAAMSSRADVTGN